MLQGDTGRIHPADIRGIITADEAESGSLCRYPTLFIGLGEIIASTAMTKRNA